MKRTVALIAAAVVMAGCSATAPAITEYTILPAHPPSAASGTPLSPHPLRIAPIRALPSLHSSELLYLREGGETGSYLYTRWSDKPAALIERSLTLALEGANLFAALLPSASSAHTPYLLESELGAFYHRFGREGRSEGVIDITFRLVDSRTRTPVGSKRFRLAVPAATADARGGVNALAEGTNRLSLECAAWLSQLIKEHQ